MHMIDVLSKLREIAENYDSEDIQRAITAAETQVHENQDDVEEGKYKSDAQRKAVHAAKKEKMSEEYDDDEYGDGFGDETNPVADSILFRLERQHPEVFMKYGPEEVMIAAGDVAEMVGDVDEIGSSDVSIWTKQTIEMLGGMDESVTEDAVEEVHEDVVDDHSLEDILKLAGRSGVMGMNQNNLLSESVYHELDEADLEEARYETDEVKLKDLVIKGQELETYAKKSGGIDKNDMMKIAAMLKKGDKSGAMKYAKKLDTDPKEYILGLMGEEVELDEAKTDVYHKTMLKALGKSRLPRGHGYTSAVASNGDFVVYDGGKRIVGRLKKGEHSIKEEADLDEARYETDEVKAIIAKHLGTARPLTDADMDNSELYQDLYDYFVSSGDMPYGTAKARDGDPDEWIFNRLDQLGMVESVTEAEEVEEGGSGDAPEYADADADDKRWDDAEEEEEGDVDMEETVEVPVSALSELMRLAGYKDYEAKINEYENDPEEEYYDTEDQMIGLSGGLNRPKKQYPQAQPGDNPMTMRALKTDDVNEEYTFESVYKRYQDFINKDSE